MKILKKLFRKVLLLMGLLDNKESASMTNRNELTKQEVEFLLQYISATAFKGENVKVVYNIVTKLENSLK